MSSVARMPSGCRVLPAILALLTTAALVSAPPAVAAWPPDPSINVPLCTTAFSSQVSAAIPDASGGAIVVWYEDRAGDFDVFARRVNSQGVPLWTNDGNLVCVQPVISAQILPKAVSDGAGGAIVVWIDNRNGANALFAQRIDSLGTRLWASAGMAVATTSSQVTYFCLAADGASGAVISWASQPGLSSDIHAQRLNASGAMQWGTAGKALCVNALDQYRPMVVRKSSGIFVVAWEDTRQGFRTDLYAQALNAAGTLQWAANGILVAGSAQNAINPMLVATGADDCLLMWDADSLGTGDVRGQRLGATGAALWPGAGLRLFPPGRSGLIGVCADGLGGAYAIVNVLEPSSGKSPLWVQRIRDTGVLYFAPAGIRVSSILSNQMGAVITRDNGNGCIVAWFDDQRGLSSNFTPLFDVFAQHIIPGGIHDWYESGVPVCRAPNQGAGLAISANAGTGLGGVVVAWSDTRNSSSPDIYAQGVDSAGRLGFGLLGVDPGAVPATASLARPSPNPAPHGATNIAYTLAGREHVQLQVVDAAGRIVTVLEDGVREPGQHHVSWDGRVRGHALPPGLYLVQLRTPSRSEIRRLVLL